MGQPMAETSARPVTPVTSTVPAQERFKLWWRCTASKHIKKITDWSVLFIAMAIQRLLMSNHQLSNTEESISNRCLFKHLNCAFLKRLDQFFGRLWPWISWCMLHGFKARNSGGGPATFANGAALYQVPAVPRGRNPVRSFGQALSHQNHPLRQLSLRWSLGVRGRPWETEIQAASHQVSQSPTMAVNVEKFPDGSLGAFNTICCNFQNTQQITTNHRSPPKKRLKHKVDPGCFMFFLNNSNVSWVLMHPAQTIFSMTPKDDFQWGPWH